MLGVTLRVIPYNSESSDVSLVGRTTVGRIEQKASASVADPHADNRSREILKFRLQLADHRSLLALSRFPFYRRLMGFRAITRGPVDYLAENCLFIGGPGSSTILIDSANDT